MTIREKLASLFLAIGRRLEKKDKEPFVSCTVKVWGNDVTVSLTRDEINKAFGDAMEKACGHGV